MFGKHGRNIVRIWQEYFMEKLKYNLKIKILEFQIFMFKINHFLLKRKLVATETSNSRLKDIARMIIDLSFGVYSKV